MNGSYLRIARRRIEHSCFYSVRLLCDDIFPLILLQLAAQYYVD